MHAISRRREILPLLALGAAVAAAWWSFLGRYAFDDSYVGYGVAQSLLQGRGFSFNGHERFLSTSAPLAPPLYALLSLSFHTSVVFSAQLLSAAAYAIAAFGSYALARRVCTAPGALAAAIAFVCGPFVLLLWSHETLLCAAACIAGMLLYVRGRHTGAALVLGAAVLLRGEVLLLLPFLWAEHARSHGLRAAAAFAGYSVAPFACWLIGAGLYFGNPLSATIASKQAQLRYAEITPYLDGLRDYTTRMYALTPARLWSVLLEMSLALCAAVGILCGLFTRLYARIALWVLLTSGVYVLLQLPFYFWFCSQLAVAMAAAVAMLWPREGTARYPLLLLLGRAGALLVVAVNAGFLILQLIEPQRKMMSYDWIVMPAIAANPYRALGERFLRSADAAGSVAYPEIGEIHYYSGGRPMVDELGIVTPGAARRLAAGNAIWTFKRYRPGVVVDTPNFRYFSDPLEYDWFWRAYAKAPDGSLHFASADPSRSVFTIYTLRDPQQIPPADERIPGLSVLGVRADRDGITFAFLSPAVRLAEIEARVMIPPACRALTLSLRTARAAQIVRERVPHAGINRLTLLPRFGPGRGPLALRISGCGGIAAAPQPRLRSGFILLGKPPAPAGVPGDALTAYAVQNVP